MKRARVLGIVAMCTIVVACGGNRDRDDANAPGDGKTAEVRPATVTQMGCLTARGDQFVLTDLERGEGEATTETFQLIGSDDELRQHVGKQVRVIGEAEASRVAVVQESTPPPATDAKPQGTTGGADPKVSTQSETRVETRKLTVSSVQPTGASCAAETTSGGAAPTRPRR
jgi:hypothetical protein